MTTLYATILVLIAWFISGVVVSRYKKVLQESSLVLKGNYMQKVGFDMQENNKFGFDMTKCKVGDKLITRGGMVVEVIEIDSVSAYPYLVQGRGIDRSVAVDGSYLFGHTDLRDIAGFADTEKQSKPDTKMLLSTDSAERKQMPITTGFLDYFPLAVAEVAKCSKAGNDQHHPGKALHWDKSKSTDHADCIARHLIDRDSYDTDGIRHSVKLAWRALAYLQIQLENEKAGK